MNVREIERIPYAEIQALFGDVARSLEFSAAATCGFNTLGPERKLKLLKALKQAGVDLVEAEVSYAVSIIANRMINRE